MRLCGKLSAIKNLNRKGKLFAKLNQAATPWHFLYFLPEPQGQGSLRPTFAAERTGFGGSTGAAPA
jgi:hypothetical protein